MTTDSTRLNVLISGGFSPAYEKLLPEFERTSGIKVTTGSGASQGRGPQTIAAQLARGVAADVVILSREGLNELAAAKRIAAGTDKDLARVPLGVAVRASTTKPDVSTVEAFPGKDHHVGSHAAGNLCGNSLRPCSLRCA